MKNAIGRIQNESIAMLTPYFRGALQARTRNDSEERAARE
jgi:hypothetical protein